VIWIQYIQYTRQTRGCFIIHQLAIVIANQLTRAVTVACGAIYLCYSCSICAPRLGNEGVALQCRGSHHWWRAPEQGGGPLEKLHNKSHTSSQSKYFITHASWPNASVLHLSSRCESSTCKITASLNLINDLQTGFLSSPSPSSWLSLQPCCVPHPEGNMTMFQCQPHHDGSLLHETTPCSCNGLKICACSFEYKNTLIMSPAPSI
jgi:hypothetical protein